MNNEYSKEDELMTENIINKFDTGDHKNIIGAPITLAMLKSSFERFKGNYLELCSKFNEMSENDQKLFILYSYFHLNLIFNLEDIGLVFTGEVLERMDGIIQEFNTYGSHGECRLRCFDSIDGPTLYGLSDDVSIPVEKENIINSLDMISIEDLATLASKATYYHNSEERMFKDMNDHYQRELDAFMDIAMPYSRKKTA